MSRKFNLTAGLFVAWLLWQACVGVALYGQESEPPSKESFWQQFKSVLAKTKSDDQSPLSVTEKFPLYYEWIHRKDQQFYDSLSKLGVVNWDKYQNIMDLNIKRDQDTNLTNKLSRRYKVFGWHPYWMGHAYRAYRFDYLSHLAWFSYNIDPSTGKYDNPDVIKAWKNSAELFDLAEDKGCKVLLTITSHTRKGNALFLKNAKSQQDVLIDSLLNLLEGRGDGVDVNFEQIPDGFEREMSEFLKKLSTKLKERNQNYILSVDLPVIDGEKNYLFDLLNPYVDLFLVTGYDYFYRGSKSDGPVAPLDLYNKQFNIQLSVNQYLQAGLPKNKLLLGLPYYGAAWTARSSQAAQRDSSLKFLKHLTYREIRARYPQRSPQYDFERWGAYYIDYNPDSNYHVKCWFDDSITLERKFAWVKQEQLGGIGIWALGYDHGHDDLWNLIKKTMVADSTLVFSESYYESRRYKLGRSLWEYRALIAVAGIFIVVFVVGGMVVALFDWRVREVFFQNKTLRLLYSIATIAIVLTVFAFYLFVSEKPILGSHNLFALGLGLVLGVAIALIIGHYHGKWMENLP